MTPAAHLVAPVQWRDRTVVVQGRERAYREAGDGEVVLLLHPPGLSGSGGGPLDQLAGSHKLIEMSVAPEGAVDDPSAREAAGLVGQLAEAVGFDHVAVVSRGTASTVALWLAIDGRATVTTLVLESPPLLTEDATFSDGPNAALLHAMPSLEVPTLILLGESTEPGMLELQLSTYKRLLPASTVGLVYDAGEDVRGDRPAAYITAVAEYLERGQAFVVSTRSTVIHA
jgi:pimeloyl-ACP methyl ester carboxylesterase